MNERLREAYRKAKLKEHDHPEPKDVLLGSEVEEFAELIVKECIQAVKNVGGYNEDYHMNAIKKYFGVEE
jgi:hypothetical protein